MTPELTDGAPNVQPRRRRIIDSPIGEVAGMLNTASNPGTGGHETCAVERSPDGLLFGGLAFCALLVAACHAHAEEGQQRTLGDSGAVVISVGMLGKPNCDSVEILYRSLNPADLPTTEELKERARKTSRPMPKKLLAFRYLPKSLFNVSRRDFDGPSSNGTVIARDMPPGEYELVNYACSIQGYPSSTIFRAREDFAVPFTVKLGEVTYLGEFLATRMLGKSLMGFWNTAYVYLVAADQSERDLEVAGGLLPVVKSSTISSQVITEATVQPEALVLKPLPQPEGAPRLD